MITGFFGGQVSLSLVASDPYSGADGISIPINAAAQAGDICIISNHCISGSAAITLVAPSGFSPLISQSGSSGTFYAGTVLSAKLLGSGDPGTTVSGMNAGSGGVEQYITAIFRPSAPIASFAQVAAFSTQTTDGNPSPQTIPAATKIPALALAVYGQEVNAIATRTSSITMNELGVDNRHYMKYKIFNPGDTLQSIDVDMNDEGVLNVLQSGCLKFE